MKKIVGIFLVGCMVLISCTGCGVSQEKYADLESNYSALEVDYSDLKTENEELKNQVQQLQEKADKVEKEYSEYKKQVEKMLVETEPRETEAEIESDLSEKGTENQEESETAISKKTWNVSELEINGELITESTVTEMIESYDYIKDVYIKVDESQQEISITVQVVPSVNIDTAKMAGEDVARYFAAQASWSTNSHRAYKAPGSDDLGSLYERYNLLLYVDDGNNSFNLHGAKVTTAKSITWR